MKLKIGAVALVALLALAGSGWAAAGDEDAEPAAPPAGKAGKAGKGGGRPRAGKAQKGVVASVDPKTGEIEIQTADGRSHALTVDKTTRLTKGGERTPIRLKMVSEGDKVLFKAQDGAARSLHVILTPEQIRAERAAKGLDGGANDAPADDASTRVVVDPPDAPPPPAKASRPEKAEAKASKTDDDSSGEPKRRANRRRF